MQLQHDIRASAGIKLLPLLKNSAINETDIVFMPLDIAGGGNQNIECCWYTSNLAVKLLCGPAAVCTLRHYNEKINITVSAEVSSSCRTK